ncbi:MAG: DUF188 domain-containing protein [Stenotrophomonas nitritireducens]|uniref:DUF188 domain-containing protein n=1 Tax=Stenotrophomonas nitritireducens TaxID=83617 RepID=A0A9D8KX26_9GAMM|nr:DUF188 domain-containing protein [Stenotrophomonas nitritireducens]
MLSKLRALPIDIYFPMTLFCITVETKMTERIEISTQQIVERVAAGDLVVTQDIPLAARVLARGAAALDPRGVPFSPDSIAQRLSIRDFMAELRGPGVQTGGPPSLHARDRQAFAARFDQWLARQR